MEYIVLLTTLAVAIIGVKLDSNDHILGLRVSSIAVFFLIAGSLASAYIIYEKNNDIGYLSAFVDAYFKGNKLSSVNKSMPDAKSEAISIAKMLSSDSQYEREIGMQRMHEMFDPSLLLENEHLGK